MPTKQAAQRMRRYASLEKAGEYTETSKWTIRRLVADGTITGFRIGRQIRVDLNELDAAMKSIPSGRSGDAA